MPTGRIKWSNREDQRRFGQPFTPELVYPFLWLDASDTSTITESSGAVSQWDDKSGNAHHALQASSSLQGVTGTQTINSLNTIYFNGDYMTITLPSAFTGSKIAYFGVFERVGLVGNASTMSLKNNSEANDFGTSNVGIFAYEGNTTILQGYRNGSALSSSTHPGTSTPYLVGSVYDGTNHTSWLNGTGATPSASTGSFDVDVINLNARWNNSAYGEIGDNKFGEIILVTGGITSAEQEQIEGYLAHKWGLTGNLPASHPYKTYEPGA